MNEADVRRRIVEAYEDETPDILGRIEASLGEVDGKEDDAPEVVKRAGIIPIGAILKRIAVVAACFIFLISGILIGKIPPVVPDTKDAAYIYLDVNPSIELAVDENDRVTACTPSNADAELVLTDLSLVGVDMNTALSAIVGAMYVNGYLTENNNSILISVESEDEVKVDDLISKTTARINAVFEKSSMTCSIIAQGVVGTEELRERAKECGVSIGKMHLANKMADILDNPDEIAIEELVGMTIGELNLMYSTAHKNDAGVDGGDDTGKKPGFDKDVVSGSLGGYKTSEDAKALALRHLSLTEADVKSVIARAIVKRDDDRRVMVYSVWVIPSDYSAVHELTIDCVSGEVLSAESHTVGLGDILEGLGDIGFPDLDIDFDIDLDFGNNGDSHTPSDDIEDNIHNGDGEHLWGDGEAQKPPHH